MRDVNTESDHWTSVIGSTPRLIAKCFQLASNSLHPLLLGDKTKHFECWTKALGQIAHKKGTCLTCCEVRLCAGKVTPFGIDFLP
jgi:hypothetical protein